MDIKKLQRVVVDALEDVKAQNIKVFNTIGLSDMFDRVVLASGTSNRQTRALAYRVAQQVKEAGGHVVSIEGAEAGEWVLVDLGDLVVHVMQPAIRDYYALEEIWGGKPVHVKITEPPARRIAQHASSDGVDEGQAAAAPVPAPAEVPAPVMAHQAPQPPVAELESGAPPATKAPQVAEKSSPTKATPAKAAGTTAAAKKAVPKTAGNAVAKSSAKKAPKTPAKKPATTPAKKAPKAPAHKAAKTPARKAAKTPAKQAAKTPAKKATKTLAKKATKTLAKKAVKATAPKPSKAKKATGTAKARPGSPARKPSRR